MRRSGQLRGRRKVQSVARSVILLKQAETERTVTYRFGPDEEHLGLVTFDKRTLETRQLEPVPEGCAGDHLTPARWKLLRFARTGSFPDRAEFAS